jgi:hypothetical protein
MEADSGTPTHWLSELSQFVVNVHCTCSADVAARRFFQRTRHPGHLDREKTLAEILAGLRALEQLAPVEAGPRVDVGTVTEPDVPSLVAEVAAAFARCPPN